jgi:hypothetical protein
MKKLISLFLIFSLVILSTNLYAKERRGAKLIVTKLDGQLIEGELITVKPNSLLLLDAEGKDVSVGIADIKVIRVVRKSNALAWAGIGFVIGALFIGTLLLSNPLDEDISTSAFFLGRGIGGAIGALIGALFIASTGKAKIIQIEALEKLRKKARIRDYK